MKTKYKIPTKLYSLDINSEKLIELCDERNDFFNQALEILDKSISENKALLVYRGEKKSDLNKKLGSSDLFYNFFHAGDSAKYFIKSNDFTRYLDDINNASNSVFEIIFDKINEIQEEKYKNAKSEFKNYFTEIKNKIIFVREISKLDEQSKLRIRDYYFSYLHQEEKDKNKSSFFVSTSKDIEVAEDYTGKRNNKILIYYFIPKPYIDLAIYSRNEPHLKKYCKDNSLPAYNAPFYNEDEVCVKGALFPSNILGVTTFINNDEIFVINPYLFYYNENNLENFISERLPVDEERFEVVLKKVNDGGGVRITFKDNKLEEIK